MLDLINQITALQIFCKDAHYSFRGIDYKPLHEWMDEISDPLGDFLDEMKESILLRTNNEVPRGTEINANAAFYVPSKVGDNNREILMNVQAVVMMVHQTINGLKDMSVGNGDILGRLDSHLEKHLGLLNLALEEKKNEKVD